MYIKTNDDKSLIITIPTTIYRGEKNADLITFLVPHYYGEQNVADCKMMMRYVLPSGLGRSEALSYLPETYKDYLQFSTPLDTSMTAERGDVTIWLTAFDSNNDVILKTGEVIITVHQSKDIDAYLPPDDLDQLDDLQARVEALENDTDEVYVPHMDDRKILSWTIEEAAGEVPDPVDLNPFDEWRPIEADGVETEYKWEPM